MKVFIMRGPSSFGKSTYAARTWPGAAVCSADHFMYEGGVYRFAQEKLPEAHRLCMTKFVFHLTQGTDVIVVDNTNIRVEDIAPYYRLAETFGAEVRVVQMVANPFRTAGRNVHGVPPNRVLAMYRLMGPLPKEWAVDLVNGEEEVPCELPGLRELSSMAANAYPSTAQSPSPPERVTRALTRTEASGTSEPASS
jgi:predicted kinase